MKNIDVYKLGFFISLCTVCYVVIVSVTSIMIFKVPTTPENAAIRSAIINLVLAIWTLCATILGYKLKEFVDDKNKL